MNERMLEKIQYLLNLANPDKAGSPEEAATALKMAHKLMEKHRISEAMLESTTKEEEEEIENDILFSAKGLRLASWKSRLANNLAEANGCMVYTEKNRYSKTSIIKVVGEPSDASVVRHMYLYLTQEIDRLTLMYSAVRGKPGKTACNSFRIGVVSMIRDRLQEAKTEARKEAQKNAGDSLAVVNAAIAKIDKKSKDAEKWIKARMKLYSSSGSRPTVDSSAYKKGRQAGKNMDLNRPTKCVGNGVRGYLSN